MELRADSGFALPRVDRFCKGHGVTYTFGRAISSRLTPLAQAVLAGAVA
ncbi:MAG: hypothetical protein IRY83_03400 [Chloroflexi bacterium]|nr:hypothetical protein [Chloroflexota bacterium]